MEKILEKYSTTTVLLLTMASLLIVIPLILDVGEFLAGILVIMGVSCIFLGSFIFMFTGNETIDPHLVGLLQVQGCMNQCRIATDTGISGKAYFLPPHVTGEPRVMQFNPVSAYYGGPVSANNSFTEEEPRGLVTVPSSDPLVQDLRNTHALVVPDRAEELSVLISETVSDVYEFAPRVTASWESRRVTVTLHKYRFIEGCHFAQKESPGCCTMFPCPACSLCGTLVAEGLNKVVALENCSPSSSGDITAVFWFN